MNFEVLLNRVNDLSSNKSCIFIALMDFFKEKRKILKVEGKELDKNMLNQIADSIIRLSVNPKINMSELIKLCFSYMEYKILVKYEFLTFENTKRLVDYFEAIGQYTKKETREDIFSLYEKEFSKYEYNQKILAYLNNKSNNKYNDNLYDFEKNLQSTLHALDDYNNIPKLSLKITKIINEIFLKQIDNTIAKSSIDKRTFLRQKKQDFANIQYQYIEALKSFID